MDNSDSKTLMHRIQVCDFALKEAALFLDTHPDNKDALAFFAKHKAMREKAYEEYVKLFGPLTPMDYDGGPEWRWVEGPWPWEMS